MTIIGLSKDSKVLPLVNANVSCYVDEAVFKSFTVQKPLCNLNNSSINPRKRKFHHSNSAEHTIKSPFTSTWWLITSKLTMLICNACHTYCSTQQEPTCGHSIELARYPLI